MNIKKSCFHSALQQNGVFSMKPRIAILVCQHNSVVGNVSMLDLLLTRSPSLRHAIDDLFTALWRVYAPSHYCLSVLIYCC